jgi:tetratricopeptide (TPR) repeat protein
MIKELTQKSPPPAKVFISATSGDLRPVRDLVKQGLLTMGCMPVEQDNFPPDYRGVKEMLEDKIAQCEAVVHIVGMRYGAEPDPTTLPEVEHRRSYTQMEADIARRLKKKLYTFICPEDFPFEESIEPEPEEKQSLQAEYRCEVMRREELYTPVESPEDVARKIRELQVELDELRRTIRRDRRNHAMLILGLVVVLAALGTGIWWIAVHGPQQTADLVSVQYDWEKVRAQLTKDIKETAAKRIVELEQKRADWRKVVEVEKWRDQQLGDLDRFLDGIAEAFQEREASKAFQKAQELLQTKGAVEALAYLEAKSEQRWKRIKDLTTSEESLGEEKRKLLREALLEASILETQFQFEEAEAVYRKVISSTRGWAKPRNDFAWFLIQRGIVIEPEAGKEKLMEAAEICRGTIVLNPKDKNPRDWAMTQSNLGTALSDQGTRTSGEAGAELLAQAVAAYREALTVYTRESLPQDWAMTQNDLGSALWALGESSNRIDFLKEARAAVHSSHLFYKEAGYSQYDAYFEEKLKEIDRLIEDLSSVNHMQPQ